MAQGLETSLEELKPAGSTAASADHVNSSSTAENVSNVPNSVLAIPVAIQVVIGSVRLPLSRITQLGAGSTIPLDQKLGAPVLILVNGKEVARGDLFVLEDQGNRLVVSITEVAGPAGHSSSQ